MEKGKSDNNTTNNVNTDTLSINDFNESFHIYLEDLNINYIFAHPYLLIGEKKHQKGWIISLSVSIIEASKYLREFIPLIAKLNAAVEIPINHQALTQILMGYLGIEQFNVVINIYPNNDKNAVNIFNIIMQINPPIRYPKIPTAQHLINNIFIKHEYHSVIKMPSDDGREKTWGINTDGSLTYCPVKSPYKLNKSIQWPFDKSLLNTSNNFNKTVGNRAVITNTLKKDIKGNVFNGIYFQEWWIPKKCIIKSGNKNDLINLYNNDSADNISFQYYIHKKIERLNIAPKAYDLVSDQQATHFVMEYIDGVKITDLIGNIQPLGGWIKLNLEKRKLILNIALQILDIIRSLHLCGVIHRDISLANFILRKDKKIILIDFGLSFDLSNDSPLRHPYTGVTIGYSAPIVSDINNYTPEYSEDIFSLGASMIMLFTGIYPSYFDPGNPATNYKKLKNLIPNEEIAYLISLCFSKEKTDRPHIDRIIEIVNRNCQSLLNIHQRELYYHYEKSDLENIVQSNINSIASSAFINNEGILESTVNTRDKEIQANFSRRKLVGFHTGISGSTTMLIQIMSSVTIKPDIIKTIINRNISYLISYLSNEQPVGNNLMNGYYGIGIAICQAIKYQFITLTEENKAILRQLIHAPNYENNIWEGTAGKGIFLLFLQNTLSFKDVDDELKKIVRELTKSQSRDGTWRKNKCFLNHFTINDLNWGMGAAGITYFLIRCRNNDNSKDLDSSIKKSLDHLMNYKKVYFRDASFIYGSFGIAQTFIKAYDCYHDKKYQDFAEDLLNTPFIKYLKNNLTYGSGLAGAGHTYLDAFKSFAKEHYYKKAEEILLYIMLIRIEYSADITYWHNDITRSTSADYMSGNMGILSFLKRFHSISDTFDTVFDSK
ncbi:serine/threonine protein kinase [Chitinophaga dinghuensis]|uniref:Serine/threonine protein kinase n=1 Tax=Chitinophaga dinghuensis TaxID=1539050 RepID=A0A327VYD8_9BACT|nr:lanthionine synthetase LanC family protein [Chitinophaga dinghuensis]RAJ81979.1 serine/threonine protein kinase [Chitinophaga dinghuensis]